MTRHTSLFLRWLGTGLVSFLFLAFLASGLVSVFVAARWLLQSPLTGLLAGTVMVVLVGILIYWAGRVPEKASDVKFLAALTVFVLVIRGLILLLAPAYEQGGDCKFMLDAIRILVRDGWGDEVMLGLAGIYYDDYLWAGRSLPFLYPLASWWPGYEVVSARVINLVWSILHNLVVYELARRLLDRRLARVAFALVSIIPLHTWMMLDYTHQYFGAFLVVAGILILVRQLDDSSRRSSTILIHGVSLGLVLICLHFQSGIDQFLLLLTIAALVLSALSSGWKSGKLVRMAIMVGVAIVLYIPVSQSFTSWQAQYRDHRMSSHPISFTARGWNVVTMGEYYGVYEQIDRETPWPDKPAAMRGLILSQMAHEPAKTLLALPVVKIAKYFLVGYATAVELQLRDAGSEQLAGAFRATRIIFAPILLGLALWGAWLLLSSPPETPSRMLIVAVPVVFCLVYLLAGETSPRYSFHVQGFIAIIAAMAYTGNAGYSCRLNVQRLALWTGLFIGSLLLAYAIIPHVIRLTAGSQLFADLRAASHAPSEFGQQSSESTCFTRTLTYLADGVGHSVQLNEPVEKMNLSLFFWPQISGAEAARLQVMVQVDNQVVFSAGLHEVRYVQRIALDLEPGAKELKVLVSGTSEALREGQPLLRWGYVRLGDATK